jgi:hypothetical protein
MKEEGTALKISRNNESISFADLSGYGHDGDGTHIGAFYFLRTRAKAEEIFIIG